MPIKKIEEKFHHCLWIISDANRQNTCTAAAYLTEIKVVLKHTNFGSNWLSMEGYIYY